MSSTNITTLGDSVRALHARRNPDSENDNKFINLIAKRAFFLFGGGRSETDYRLDLVCVHTGTCPLDLVRLLESNENDFIHDIAGIARHLNHKSFKLEDCFVPRFSM